MDVNKVLEYGTRLLIVFMCIPVHEFAHAWAATKLGDDTPKIQGRLTLNPIAHFDIVGGIGILLCGFGWGKPVQVNPVRFDRKHNMRAGMAITAAAGPISNIIMAFFAMIIAKLMCGGFMPADLRSLTSLSNLIAYYSYDWISVDGPEVLGWLMKITYFFIVINLGLAVFNLVPVPPLDGQKILTYFLPDRILAKIEPYERYISATVLVLIIFTNVLNKPLGWASDKLFGLMDLLTRWVDPIVNSVFK